VPAIAAGLLAMAAGGPDVAVAACDPAVACLEATFPAGYVWGALDAGNSGNVSGEQVITVTSTAPWGIRISSDLDDGRMKEWTGSAYVASAPRVLGNPLTWGLTQIGSTPQTPDYQPLSSTPASVVSGVASTCSATCGSTEIGVRYRQVVGYGDVSAGTNDYRLQVSFEAAQGF
jgi:hypothetical protein